MSSRPPRAPASPPPAVPPALSAFLRGVERRGAVLAELQAGDAMAGDAALAAAMRAFLAGAEAQPMAEWPARFWTLLLAAPALRRGGAGHGHGQAHGHWPSALGWLGRVPPGPRAALLLRLAAGLDAPQAADVLAIAPNSYRLALRRALPHHADGRADTAAWAGLRAHVHRRIKTLPAERLAHLAHLREVALSPQGAQASPADADARRGPVRVLWILFALCMAALAATWLWPAWLARGGVDDIEQTGLREERAAARFDDPFAAITHRDFDLLADPDGLAAAESLAFHSWLAAQPDLVDAVREEMAEDEGDTPATGAREGSGPDASATGRGETVDVPR